MLSAALGMFLVKFVLLGAYSHQTRVENNTIR
jgi:hypothetical protein